MRAFKLTVWILALYVIQAVFGDCISVFGASPDFMLAFAIAFSFMEKRVSKCGYIIVICAVLGGACVGRVFPVVVFLPGLSGVFAHILSGYLRFVPGFVRVTLLTLAAAIATGAVECLTAVGYVDFSKVFTAAVYTAVMSVAVYYALKRTLFKENIKSLIIGERN